MPRYFFNIRDGYDVDEDEEGIELPDLEAARAEALATVEELRDELADAGRLLPNFAKAALWFGLYSSSYQVAPATGCQSNRRPLNSGPAVRAGPAGMVCA